MKVKKYLFRLVVGLLALALGLGVYWIFEYLQRYNEEIDLCLVPSERIQLADYSPIFEKQESLVNPKVEETPNEFYPDGEFYQEDKLTGEFKDFIHFEVTTEDWTNATEKNDYQPKPIIPKGLLQARKKYKFVKISAANWMLSFETEKIDGINYSFTGNYLKNSTEKENWIDLKGTLIKYKHGKKIAQMKLGLLSLADAC
jgi:hypothetical protein